MKTKIRRYSRRTMSVILSILMVMTCLVAGQILTVNAYSTYKLSTPKTKGNSTWKDYDSVSSGGTLTINFKDLGYSENDFVQFGVKGDGNDWLAYGGSESNYMGNGSTFNFYKTSNQNAYLKLTKPIVKFTFTTNSSNVSVKTEFSGSFSVTATPAASPSAGGTATVNGSTSAVSGLASGATVSLSATPNTDYQFDKWSASPSSYATIADKNSATTTATITGNVTLTANFKKDAYTVTLNDPSNGTLTGTSGSVAWDDTVSVTATPNSGYKVTSLDYNDGSDHNIWTGNATSATTKTFSMPKHNATVTATFTALPMDTVTYGKTGNGYVSVGVAKTAGSEKNMITRSLTSGTDQVLEGTAVNFCAIPQKGYKFDGWYDSDSYSNRVSTDKDYQVTSDYTLYAKFVEAPNIITSDPVYSSTKYRLVFKASDYDSTNKYIYTFGGLDSGTWPGKKVSSLSYATNGSGDKYYYVESSSSFTYIMNNGNSGYGNQTGDQSANTKGTIKVNYPSTTGDYGTVSTSSYTKTDISTADPNKQLTDVYPVTLNVTKPDYGTTNIKAYCEAGQSVTLKTSPNSQKKVSATQDGTSKFSNDKTANKSTTITMPSSGATSTTVAVTYANYDNYTVTYNTTGAGSGTVTAKLANGTVVPSGSTVLEDTNVTFTATADSGSYFSTWSGGDSSSTNPKTKTITANTTMTANFIVDGYQLYSTAGNGTTYTASNMKLLENGWYISKSITTNSKFTLKHIGPGKYINAGGGNSTYYKWKSDWRGYNCKDDVSGKWTETSAPTSSTTATKLYQTTVSSSVYCVYDPVNDKVWVTDREDGLHDITVYFKNGTVRSGYTEEGFHYTSEYGTSSVVTSGYSPTSEYSSQVQKFTVTAAQLSDGVEIELKTVVNDGYTGYYVKGFAVNDGLTQGIISQEFDDETGNELTGYTDYDKIHGKSGVESGRPWNSFKLKLKGFQDDNIEITPIYFKTCAKSNDTVRFYANDFIGEVKKDWGGMLAVYSFGSNGTDAEGKNSGIYPGQPMVNEGGRYMMDVPTNDTSITMNNYIWDKVHNDLFLGGVSGDDLNNKHYQTYDYNEFNVLYQIFQASKTAHASDPSVVDLSDEDITFSFKYRNDQTNHGTKATSQLADRIQYSPGKKDTLNWKGTRGNTTTYDSAKDYQTGYNTIDPSADIYAFEDLTDFYGNRIDMFGDHVDVNGNSVKAAYNPILAVSNGYDFNSAGDYATAWALYKPTNLTGDPGTYTLFDVIGGQGLVQSDNVTAYYGSESYFILPSQQTAIRQKYDASQAGTNFVYDLARVPVKISYEYNVKDGHANHSFDNKKDNGDIAFRSDGHWDYTTSDQMIKSNVIVALKDGDNYIRDYFQDGGVDYNDTTNYDPDDNITVDHSIKAYFANSNYVESEFDSHQNVSGQTVAYALSDGEHTFNLRTEEDPQGNYEFVGWYLYNGTDYILASEDKEYDTESRSNDVFAAVYRKVPSGNVQITHALDSTSVGTGECFVTVDVVNAGGTTVTGGAGTKTSGAVKIGSNFIKYNSDNKLKITLETVPELFANLEDFYEQIVGDKAVIRGASISDVTDSSVSLDKANNKVVVTIPIISLFSGEDQTIKSLPFFSKLVKPTYSYSLTYIFPTYRGGGATKSYTINDNFTEEELEEFMTRDASGDLKFLSEAGGASTDVYRNTFLSNHAPKEDNYMQTVSYTNFDAEHLTLTYPSATSISATIKPVTSETQTVNVTFDLPYAINESTFEPTTISEDKVTKGSLSKSVVVNYLDWYVLSGKKNAKDETNVDDPVFIKAPLLINDNGTTEYFCYWSVIKPESYGKAAVEITRCYDYEFNLSLFMNCTVTPVYNEACKQTTPPTAWDAWNYFDANQVMKNCGSSEKVSISFVENSRNQYNHDSAVKVADDRIYTDFLLNFNGVAKDENGLPYKLKTLTTPKKCGLIIEGVNYLSKDSSGKFSTSATVYSTFDSSGKSTDEIRNFISGGTSATLTGCKKSEFSTSSLDNKNCCIYYYGIMNRKYDSSNTVDQLSNDSQSRYKVYRAYAYLCNADYTNISLSDPIYFTIYDLASVGLADNDTRS